MTAVRGTVIVNADDFGMSTAVNRAIVYCFQQGLISSTTLLANFCGFEEACEFVREQRLLNSVGVHINLTEGQPLLQELRDNPVVCGPDGNFRRQRPRILGLSDLRQIAAEVAAQIDRCRSQGLPLNHADSHQHVHTEPLIFSVVRRELRRAGIPFLRVSRTLAEDDHWSMLKAAGKRAFNGLIQLSGLRCTRHLTSVTGFERARAEGSWQTSSWEIMTHPTLDERGVLMDHVERLPLEARLRQAFTGIRLASFAEAGRRQWRTA
ncbi:MAG: carbohydrate deacetylase [Planctomycetaceae bacterium]